MRCFLAGLAVALSSAPAAAAPPSTARLLLELGPGAGSCPGPTDLAADVARRLGRDPFRDDAPRAVRVRIAADPPGLRARVQLLDPDGSVRGERELTSPGRDCRELASSLAFALSVGLAPLAPDDPPPAAPPPASDRPRLRAALGASLSLGAAPALAPGVVGQLGLAWPRASLSAEVRLDAEAGRAVPGGRVDSALRAGTLVPCLHAGPLLGCGVLAAGALRGAGSGVDEPRSTATFFAALGPRLAFEPAVTSTLALRLWADALVPVTRTRLRLDGQEAWVSPPLSASLGLGLAVRFP